MAKVATLEDLFIDELRDLYDGEKQLTKALPKMAKASSSGELRTAFESHLRETQNQVARLEQIFGLLDEKATGKKCAAMTGLIKEGDEIVSSTDDTSVRDAGLILAAQKVEHYEMSGYGSARTHAQLLGHVEAVSLLQETLNEEKQADRKLNDIAESSVNEDAQSVTASSNGHRTRRPAAPKPAAQALLRRNKTQSVDSKGPIQAGSSGARAIFVVCALIVSPFYRASLRFAPPGYSGRRFTTSP
jgi:ferritin-like metal-binding protein YciE